MPRTILQPTWMIDGTGAPAQEQQAIVVDGDRIEAVIPAGAVEVRQDDHVLALDGATVLPGLINNHVHLVLPGDNTPFVPWIDLQSDASLALWAAYNAGVSLSAGVTTVRDCGGRGTIVLDVRDAQAQGRVRGARITSCGWTLTITGGHTRQFGGEVDGEDALRQMVRRVISRGADFVKVMAAGGGTPGSLPQYPSFTAEELRAIVETAHMLGRQVSAHCIATASITNAVAAGVDLIEHASFYAPDGSSTFDPEVAEQLAASGIPVTPTLAVSRDLLDRSPAGPERDVWQRRQEAQRTIVAHLRELGVPLLAGSDAGWRATAFDTFWTELDELVASGLSPVAAVNSATGAVAQALGLKHLGTIAPGRVADLVVVDGNLAEDIRCLTQVQAVFQNGSLAHAQRAFGA